MSTDNEWIMNMWYICIHNGIWLNHKKEWNNAICTNMDATRNDHTQWNKSERERQIPCNITYGGGSLVTKLVVSNSCNPMDHSHKAPPSIGFPRQKYWSGLPFASPWYHLYMEPKIWYKWTYLQNKQTHRLWKQTWLPKGKGGEGRCIKSLELTDTHYYIK